MSSGAEEMCKATFKSSYSPYESQNQLIIQEDSSGKGTGDRIGTSDYTVDNGDRITGTGKVTLSGSYNPGTGDLSLRGRVQCTEFHTENMALYIRQMVPGLQNILPDYPITGILE